MSEKKLLKKRSQRKMLKKLSVIMKELGMKKERRKEFLEMLSKEVSKKIKE